jgi:hypothetical protein
MNQHPEKTILVEVFRRLTPEQRSNLRHHAKVRTPICCGRLADKLIDRAPDGRGMGCPAQLALDREPPPIVYPADDGWYVPAFHAAMNLAHRMSNPALGVHVHYLSALYLADEETVREAILEATT